jgi:hypothetical protein
VILDHGGRDLDNYLLPVARRIGPARLDAAFGRRLSAAASTIALAPAAPDPVSPGEPQLSVRVTGSSERRAWKQQIHDSCRAVTSMPLPPGSLAVCIRFGVSSRRNWSALWKPAIDALGPTLGIPDPARPFRPDDDRITDLALHRAIDDGLGDDVTIDAWWSPSCRKARPAQGPQRQAHHHTGPRTAAEYSSVSLCGHLVRHLVRARSSRCSR